MKTRRAATVEAAAAAAAPTHNALCDDLPDEGDPRRPLPTGISSPKVGDRSDQAGLYGTPCT